MNETKKYDVAIVGGGISGLYVAWRLSWPSRTRADGTPLHVAVFEASKHLGGRLCSLRPPGISNFTAEMGGMRFLTTQKRVTRLIDELQLPVLPFVTHPDDSIQHLRNKRFRRRDYREAPHRIPYHLEDHEQGKTPEELIKYAIEMAIPEATSTVPPDWDTVKWEGIDLWQLGFWNVLAQVISPEAYALAQDASGYDTTLSNWNAAAAMPWFLSHFAPGTEHKYIVGGYSSLPYTLKKRLIQTVGKDIIQREHRLIGVRKQGESFALKFAGQENEVYADHVVLAMPRRSLEIVAEGFPELKRAQRFIGSVMPIPMFKIFFCYERPWWRMINIEEGQSTTTLPLRQCYYFGAEGVERDSRALMLASYEDGRNVEFWKALSGRGRKVTEDGMPLPVPELEARDAWIYNRTAKNARYPHLYELREQLIKEMERREEDPEDNATERWLQAEAPTRLVIAAHRQIHEMHGLRFTPMPYAAAFKDWTEDPFGGGVNYWKAGIRSSGVKQVIRQPLPLDDTGKPTEPKWNVYICGEAYSSHQGWVEGALETAEDTIATLQAIFPL
jgi:monoamine oxidase